MPWESLSIYLFLTADGFQSNIFPFDMICFDLKCEIKPRLTQNIIHFCLLNDVKNHRWNGIRLNKTLQLLVAFHQSAWWYSDPPHHHQWTRAPNSSKSCRKRLLTITILLTLSTSVSKKNIDQKPWLKLGEIIQIIWSHHLEWLHPIEIQSQPAIANNQLCCWVKMWHPLLQWSHLHRQRQHKRRRRLYPSRRLVQRAHWRQLPACPVLAEWQAKVGAVVGPAVNHRSIGCRGLCHLIRWVFHITKQYKTHFSIVKMEFLVREMQDVETGVPVRSQKLFLTSIPSAFMGNLFYTSPEYHFLTQTSLQATTSSNGWWNDSPSKSPRRSA